MGEIQFPIVIVIGLSGSGKSTALDVFEDIGFFKLDGVPAHLIPSMVKELSGTDYSEYRGLVLGIDIRHTNFTDQFETAIKELSVQGIVPHIFFFEAKPEVLFYRYASTRRPHPLDKGRLGLEQAFALEKKRLDKIKQLASLVVDTSDYSIHNLRRSLQAKWKSMQEVSDASLRVHLISFGFKHGTPSEADMLFDLRFLPNPYFEPNLKSLSGQDDLISQYVLGSEQGKSFFERLQTFLLFTLEQMEKEGRYRITVGIGCTGGRHRSVALSEALSKVLAKQYAVSLEHRHIDLV